MKSAEFYAVYPGRMMSQSQDDVLLHISPQATTIHPTILCGARFYGFVIPQNVPSCVACIAIASRK